MQSLSDPTRRGAIWFALIMAIAVVAAIAPEFADHTPSLVERSRPTYVYPRSLSSGNYKWLDDHTIVASDSGHFATQVCVYDLNARRMRFRVTAGSEPMAWELSLDQTDRGASVSQDGSRVLWRCNDTAQLVSLEDRSMRIAFTYFNKSNPAVNAIGPRIYDISGFAWMNDGRSWIDYEWAASAGAYVVVRDPIGRIIRCGAVKSPTALELAGRLANGDVLLYDYSGTVWEVAVSPAVSVVRTWHRTLPDSLGAYQIVASPNGQRLLWWIAASPPIVGYLHWLLRKDTVDELGTLQVSGPDGSRIHTIATERSQWNIYRQSPYGGFRWMPDSRHISFIYRGKIWIMAA